MMLQSYGQLTKGNNIACNTQSTYMYIAVVLNTKYYCDPKAFHAYYCTYMMGNDISAALMASSAKNLEKKIQIIPSVICVTW